MDRMDSCTVNNDELLGKWRHIIITYYSAAFLMPFNDNVVHVYTASYGISR